MYESIIAKRYARAFLNVFAHKINFEIISKVDVLIDFFCHHQQAFFYIKLSCIKSTIKKDILIKVFERFGLHDIFIPLFDLLIKKKRLFLIIQVLSCLSKLYKADHNSIDWTITSSHQLLPEELVIIKNFIERKTHKGSHYNYHIDKNLIAGIRICSDTLLWEHSVADTLRKIKTV